MGMRLDWSDRPERDGDSVARRSSVGQQNGHSQDLTVGPDSMRSVTGPLQSQVPSHQLALLRAKDTE